QADPIARCRSDQGGAPYLHRADGRHDIFERRHARRDELVRQPGLVDDAHRPAVRLEPDGTHRFAVHAHGPEINPASIKSKASYARRRSEMLERVPVRLIHDGAAPWAPPPPGWRGPPRRLRGGVVKGGEGGGEGRSSHETLCPS